MFKPTRPSWPVRRVFKKEPKRFASRHNLSLLHVRESEEVDLSVFQAEWGGVKPMLQIRAVELEYADGDRKRIADAFRRLRYYAEQIRLENEASQVNLDIFLQHNQSFLTDGSLDVFRWARILCPPQTCVIAPDDGEIPLKPLLAVHVLAGVAETPQIISPRLFEPDLLRPPVTVKDVLTGKERVFQRHDLPLGVDTKFEVGEFYERSPIGFYYCESVEGNLVTLILVESFQMGKLMQARLAIDIRYEKYYLPVTDETTLQRLRRRFEQYTSAWPQNP